MKKILNMSLLFLTLINLGACQKQDINLEPNIIKDQYRTYYEIFVGAFSDGNGDGLGDFKGLYNRLDYLNDGNPNKGKDLGIDGIWLMPIMQANSYHKYDVMDYCSIDKDYGTMEDFDKFLNEANKRGINVIIDLVINHTSNLHPWFKEATNAILEADYNNKYVNYYSIVKEEEKETNKKYYEIGSSGYYYEGNFSPVMPELNMDNKDVKEEIKEIIKFWLDKGVGGFRLDAAKFVYLDDTKRNVEFWNWFMDEVRKIKKDAYVVGEVWNASTVIEEYYQAINCFDFDMSQNGGKIAYTANGNISVNEYVEYLNEYRNIIEKSNPNAILNPFISNHDMNRAAGYLKDEKMKVAANLYMLSSGNPFIYYGEEIGMKGSRGISDNTDANRRLAMLWGDRDKVKDPEGTTYDSSLQTNGTVKSQLRKKDSLLKHYQKLIKVRNANPEIARGKYTPINFEDQFYFGGYLSTYNDSTIGIFHNTSKEEITIDLSKYTTYQFEKLRSFIGENEAKLNGQILTIEPYTSVVLK